MRAVLVGLSFVLFLPLHARAEIFRDAPNAVARAHDMKHDASGFSRAAMPTN